MGKAYGFFKCNASKGEIEAEMPGMRNAAQTPGKLEVSLTEGLDSIKGDEGLMSLVKQLRQKDFNFAMEGNYPSATNQDTAGELGNILNMAYKSNLYKPGEPFYSEVVYQEADGSYNSLE